MKTIAGVLDKKGRGKKLRPFSNGPEGAVTTSEAGDAYVITTKLGTRIAFDTCGRCSLHVKHCKCARGSTLPRSIEYIWDCDEAMSKSEEWDINHPNYRGSFTARETKRNLRMSLPEPARPSQPVVAVVVKKKSLQVYVERARKSREEGVKRLLRGKRK